MIEWIIQVLRGGSWVNNPTNLRSTCRDSYHASGGRSIIGFRLVVRIKDE